MKPTQEQLVFLGTQYSECLVKKTKSSPQTATAIERVLTHLIINGPITSQEAAASELKVPQLASVVHRLRHRCHLILEKRDVIRHGYGGKPTRYKQYWLKTGDLEFAKLLVNCLREKRGIEHVDWNALVFCRISELLGGCE